MYEPKEDMWTSLDDIEYPWRTIYGSFCFAKGLLGDALLYVNEFGIYRYCFWYPNGYEGEWVNYRIPLPSGISPSAGTSITYRLVAYVPPSIRAYFLIGQLYFIPGGDTNLFYRYNFFHEYQAAQFSIAPPDSSIIPDTIPLFKWESLTASDSYQFELAYDKNFDSIIISAKISTNQYQLSFPLKNGTHYWRIKSLSNPNWSKIYTFQILRSGWERLRDLPTIPIDNGGAICYHKYQNAESIYAFVGNERHDFYCYSINGHKWLPDLPTLLPQRRGSSIASSYKDTIFHNRFFLAVFGGGPPDRYYYYDLDYHRWEEGYYELPDTLKEGASLAYYPESSWLYLTIGGERDSFYVCKNPIFKNNNFAIHSFKNEKFLSNFQNFLTKIYTSTGVLIKRKDKLLKGVYYVKTEKGIFKRIIIK
ncbi:MAG: hypothetical protein ABIK90_00225 [candidate division WOR-3 bacterium]